MMMRATESCFILILVTISAVLMSESAANHVSSDTLELDVLCENHCRKQSFRLRQVTTTNDEENENCKDKCKAYYNNAKLVKTLQEANLDWKDVACQVQCEGVPFMAAQECITDCRESLPGLMKKSTLQEASDWTKDSVCGPPCELRALPGLMKKTLEEANWDWRDVLCLPACSQSNIPERCMASCRKDLSGLMKKTL